MLRACGAVELTRSRCTLLGDQATSIPVRRQYRLGHRRRQPAKASSDAGAATLRAKPNSYAFLLSTLLTAKGDIAQSGIP